MWTPLFLMSLGVWGGSSEDLYQQIQSWRKDRISDTSPTIPADAYRRAIEDGETVTGMEVVEGVRAGKAYGVRVYDLPIGTVWKAISDEPHHVGFLPLKESKVVRGKARANHRILYQYTDLPVVSDRWWLTEIEYNGALYQETQGEAWEMAWEDRTQDQSLRATLDPALFEDGMPVAWTRGAWLLVKLEDNRTLVEYHLWSDPGGSVPIDFVNRMGPGQVKKTLDAIGRVAKEIIPFTREAFEGPDGKAL